MPICVHQVHVCVCEMEMNCESESAREREGESKLQKGQILFKPLLEKSIFLFHLKTHFPFLLLVAEKLTAHSHSLTLSLSLNLSLMRARALTLAVALYLSLSSFCVLAQSSCSGICTLNMRKRYLMKQLFCVRV